MTLMAIFLFTVVFSLTVVVLGTVWFIITMASPPPRSTKSKSRARAKRPRPFRPKQNA